MTAARAALTAAAVLGFLGVTLGAFGAHALRARVSEAELAIYHTGVEYLFYHALALLALAAIAPREGMPARATVLCWTLGSLTATRSVWKWKSFLAKRRNGPQNKEDCSRKRFLIRAASPDVP